MPLDVSHYYLEGEKIKREKERREGGGGGKTEKGEKMKKRKKEGKKLKNAFVVWNDVNYKYLSESQ